LGDGALETIEPFDPNRPLAVDADGKPSAWISMTMNSDLFSTSVIGSLPRPQFVKDLIADDCPIEPDEYHRLMGDAISTAVAMQEMAGLDVVTDGEWWRKSYIGVIAELAHGFELSRHPADGRPWTVVVDRLSPKRPGFIAQEIKFLKRLTKNKLKATVPAPALLGERMWDAEKSSKAYPKREDFVRDCVPILRREVELLRDEGVSIVQVDDPHLCLFVDPQVRSEYDDADRAADFAVDMDNQVVEGIRGVKLAVHLCRRAGARARGEADHRGSYDPILHQLGRLKVDHITMEFTSPGAGDMSVFKRLPEHVEIGLGCVSCQPGQIDTADTIVERVETALKHVAPERITLNPDCGFAPGSAADVSLDEVYTKLKNEVEAARRLREKYSR
jgi:5-methyltetrahydropteroyltriglutamate--homocysteine methyltransferase